jgi:signal transduction histidine kinase
MSVHGETVEGLLVEVEDLHASRARLVAAADAERRALERQLHDGVQQQLVALVVNLQLARGLCVTDPAAAGALLEDVGRDARDALEQLRRLAVEIYPPLLEPGLVAVLRGVAAEAGIVARVEAEAVPRCRPEVATTVYLCCLEALRNVALHAGADAKATVSVRVEGEALVFEIGDDGCGFVPSAQPKGGLRRVSDRVDALGGRLGVESRPGHGTSVSGSLPLAPTP